MSTSNKNKIILRVSVIILILLGVGITIGSILQYQEKHKFLTQGKRSQAIILRKDEMGAYSRKRRSSKKYYFLIGLFSDTSAVVNANKVQKSDNINDKIDALFENIAAERRLDEYNQLTVQVHNNIYYNHKTGDKITVVYLPEDPENVKLLEELE